MENCEECPVCLRDFDSSLKAYMLNWGHYFCLEDLENMYNDSNKEEHKDGKKAITWYICKQQHFVNSNKSLQKQVVVKK